MMTTYERSDIIHKMKMNRLVLSDSDMAYLEFNGQIKGEHFQVSLLVVEDLPQVSIKQDEKVVFSEMVKSVDDLKIPSIQMSWSVSFGAIKSGLLVLAAESDCCQEFESLSLIIELYVVRPADTL